MTTPSPDTVRRIEDAAAALIAAGTPNPTNEQVRQHLGGGSLSHISPVMRAFRARQREQAAEQTAPLPPELAQLLTGQLGLLWQAAVKQAEAGVLAAREQADDDIARADQERDEALAKVAALESELAVLREVVAERDRLLQEVRELRAEALPGRARALSCVSAAIGTSSASFACATIKNTCAVICVISSPSGLGTSNRPL